MGSGLDRKRTRTTNDFSKVTLEMIMNLTKNKVWVALSEKFNLFGDKRPQQKCVTTN